MASIGCELGEIELFIDLELPKIIKKREKHDNDRILMKQLLSNIERNRAKIRYEIFEADSLSHPRKLAISGIKEKLDQQGRALSDELSKTKEKTEFYRRKEERLRQMKRKLEEVKMQEQEEGGEERRAELVEEVQIDYDKYLKLYYVGEDLKRKLGGSKSEVRKSELLEFQTKWADYLKDEAEQDLKPIVRLDPDREIFNPK